jgi:prepilin-type N-terminal cleavage/methylation domain-containing protein/prepilin-type processing-associated H-X9-DG protein
MRNLLSHQDWCLQSTAVRAARFKRGFTLVELLVVIAIIGILVALLLPAVQAAREAARRTECINHEKQYGLGLLNYHNDYKRFPPGGTANWSLKYSPKCAPFWDDNRGTWIARILPYLEEQSLFDRISPLDSPDVCNPIGAALANRVLPAFLAMGRCPSDGFAREEPYCNYVGSMGPTCLFGGCADDSFDRFCEMPGIYKRTSLMPGLNAADKLYGLFSRIEMAKVSLKDVTDGTSKTLFVGENLVESELHLRCVGRGTTPFQAAYWAHVNGGSAHGSTTIPINWPIDPTLVSSCGMPNCNNAPFNPTNFNASMGFKSAHPGGANFLFVDGSVQFISEDIDHTTYQFLGHRYDEQVLNGAL